MAESSSGEESSPRNSGSSQGYLADHVVILYASETGNAQDTAERVGREYRRLGRRCVVISMDMFDIFDLPHIPLLVLITSTHGRGDPPPAMLPLWSALLRSSLPEDILEDVNFSLYGLGDSSYERFSYAGKMLARRMESLGAVPMGEPAWGDERAPDGLEETFLPWLKQTIDQTLPHLPPAPDGFVIAPTTAIPPPIFALTPAAEPPSLASLSISAQTNGHASSEAAPARAVDSKQDKATHVWKPDDWGWATVTKNHRVTRRDWWQDVREIELDIEEESLAHYEPGSICSLQPQTDPVEVDVFLEMMDLQQRADEPFYIESVLSDQLLPPHLPPSDHPTTIRSLLSNHLDIRCSPRKSFFEWLRRFTTDDMERDRLDDFINDPDEIHNYATRPSRTILETLADFRHTKIPISYILEVLPPLRRRQFSIASSSSAHPGKVQLLVALVEYKTNMKIPRRGLCSYWLKDLPVGTRVPIKINPPTLHLPDPSVPLILVGPGTGVAPMRALIEERLKQGAAKRTILYFGCRSATADYFYASEWEQYRALGLRVEAAASRDQEDKTYVQHLIRRDKALIKDWLFDDKGYVFISGSSNAMPREVREAIAWSISSDGAGDVTEEGAKEYVEDLFESGRGAEESW